MNHKILITAAVCIIAIIGVAAAVVIINDSDEDTEISLSNEDTGVTVRGNFEEGSRLDSKKVEENDVSDEHKQTLKDNGLSNESKPVYYDISVKDKDNIKILPKGKVLVSLDDPFTSDNDVVVHHFKSESEVEILKTTKKDGKIFFETDSFSLFALSEMIVFVTFNPNGGIPTVTSSVLTKLPYVISSATKDGIPCAGWVENYPDYDNSDIITKITEHPGKKNLDLTAVWEYKVTFKDDDGSVIQTEPYYSGQRIKALNLPEREGYLLYGWEHDDGWLLNTPGHNNPVNGDVTLHAVWVKISKVTFEWNIGDEKKTESHTFITSHKLDYTPSIPEGYKLLGWYDDNGTLYDEDSKITKDVTLVAKLQRISYTVTFDVANFGAGMREEKVLYGDVVSKPTDPKVEGRTFAGWYLDNDPYDFSTPVKRNITLVAHFDMVFCKVTFDYGFDTKTQTVEYGATVYSDSTGYKSVTWYLGDNEYDFSEPVKTDIKLTARGDRITCKVTFDAANFGAGMWEKEVPYGDAVSKPTDPVSEGRIFHYWSNGGEYDFSKPVTEDIWLVADWEYVKYKVTFDYGYESKKEIVECDYNSAVPRPEDPKVEGRTFTGWYLDNDPYDFSTPVTKNIKLTAKWE